MSAVAGRSRNVGKTWIPGSEACLRLDTGWPGPVCGDRLCTPGGAAYEALRVIASPHVEGRFTVIARRLARHSLAPVAGVWLVHWYRRSSRGRGRAATLRAVAALEPCRHVVVVLGHLRDQGAPFEAAWSKALGSLPRTPRGSSAALRAEAREWHRVLRACEPAFRACYEGRTPKLSSLFDFAADLEERTTHAA